MLTHVWSQYSKSIKKSELFELVSMGINVKTKRIFSTHTRFSG